MEETACPTCGSCSGMFTANSMNCLTEAIGLALPGNGTTLATHVARQGPVRAGRRGDRRDHQAVLRRRRRVGAAALDRHAGTRSRTRWRSTSRWAARPTRSCTCSPPRTRRASTSGSRRSTSCHGGCRACARSRRSSSYHVEDVHRAGGIHTILGELDRAGLLNRTVHTVHGQPIVGLGPAVGRPSADEAVELYHAAPGGVRTTKAYSQSARWDVARPRRRPPGASATWRTRTPPTAGSHAVRQPGAGRRDREDRRGPRGAVDVLRARPGCSSRRRTPWTASSPAG